MTGAPAAPDVAFPDAEAWPGDRPALVGGDLRPATVLEGYRSGYFPWPPMGERWLRWHEERWGADVRAGRIHDLGGDRGFAIPWWSPEPRAVIGAAGLRLTKNLAREARNAGWTSTVDAEPVEVVERSGVRRSGESWIAEDMSAAFVALAAEGHVHSVELWDGDELIAGLFCVAAGGVLSVPSGFHDRPSAGTLAFADLAERLARAGGALVDVWMLSRHLELIGAEEIPRTAFLRTLRAAWGRDVALPRERLPVARLAALRAAPPG